MRSSLGWRGGFVRVTAPPARLPTPSPARSTGSGVGGVGRGWPGCGRLGVVPREGMATLVGGGAGAQVPPGLGGGCCAESRPGF